jgi:hypothetical protein
MFSAQFLHLSPVDLSLWFCRFNYDMYTDAADWLCSGTRSACAIMPCLSRVRRHGWRLLSASSRLVLAADDDGYAVAAFVDDDYDDDDDDVIVAVIPVFLLNIVILSYLFNPKTAPLTRPSLH